MTDRALETPDGWRFHHLGLACRDVAREARGLGAIGYHAEGLPIDDTGLGVRVAFLVGGGPRIELVAPLEAATGAAMAGVLDGWLSRGAKLYHAAYEVQGFDTALEGRLRGQAKLVAGPAPAVAFGGRQVAFLMLRNGYLVELVEAAK